MCLTFKLILLVFIPYTLIANDSIRPVVKMGYLIDGLSNVQYKDTRIAFELLIDSIAVHDNLEVSILYYKKEEDIIKDYENNEFGNITINAYFYLKNMHKMDKVNKKCWLIKQDKDSYEEYVLLTRDPKIKSIKDLNEKKIAIYDDNYLGKMFLKKEILEYMGESARNFSYKFVYTKKHSTAILKTFFGKSDACIVPLYSLNLVTELNPIVGRTLKSLVGSPKIFAPVVAFAHNDANQVHVNVYADHVKSLASTPRGQNILDLFSIYEVKEVGCKDLIPMKEYFKRYKSLESSLQ